MKSSEAKKIALDFCGHAIDNYQEDIDCEGGWFQTNSIFNGKDLTESEKTKIIKYIEEIKMDLYHKEKKLVQKTGHTFIYKDESEDSKGI